MTLRRTLKPEEALLVGRLTLTQQNRWVKPVLTITVWCPYCKRTHGHGWPDALPFRSDHVSHRSSHCVDGSPFQHGGYWIGLDPMAKDHNRLTVARFETAMREWEATKQVGQNHIAGGLVK